MAHATTSCAHRTFKKKSKAGCLAFVHFKDVADGAKALERLNGTNMASVSTQHLRTAKNALSLRIRGLLKRIP